MKVSVQDTSNKVIKHIQFSLLKPQDVVKISEFEIPHHDLYTRGTRDPAPNGVLDRRLGVIDKTSVCETCGQTAQTCVGHYAYIKLTLPVFHVGYFKHVISILQCICKTCSRVMLEEADRRKFLRRFRRPGLENLQRQATFKAVNTQCRKVTYCPYCMSTNGIVKKAKKDIKIVHEKFRSKKTEDERLKWREGFNKAIEYQKDLAPHIAKAVEDMHPLRVLTLFENITDEDCELLGMHPEHGRPEQFIWHYISVPPVAIRPSVQQDGASNEDDLTVKLTEIVFCNALIREGLRKGNATSNIMENWDFLQAGVALYINSEQPNLSPAYVQKPIRGFCQRLKGKQGRFRGNLSGKRVDFSGRTVISPDPNLRIDEVAIPKRVAVKLTYPARVNEYNIESLRQAVRNGPLEWPGANFVQSGAPGSFGLGGGIKRFLMYANRFEVADRLQVGDVVERHLIDGDVILFNRQPSLHKLSIMCHRVKVRPWRTFRLNECVCGPYGADFDGDEMNIHVPQTEEARTEALELMSVKKNLVTPRNGEPVIAATQDFVTAAYLLSNRDTFYDRRAFTQICTYMADALEDIDLPPPTIWRPECLWTGKQIFNVLMRPNSKSRVLVNVESPCNRGEKPTARYYPLSLRTLKPGRSGDPQFSFAELERQAEEAEKTGKMKDDPYADFCQPLPMDLSPNDGWLVIVNSEIMCGVMDKATVGSGKKKSVFGAMLRDFGPDAAAAGMNRLAKLCGRWLSNFGFSLGISDVTPGAELRARKEKMVVKAYDDCTELIQQAKLGKLANKPGCDQDQTLEASISSILSKVRESVGDICMKELSIHNAPRLMSICGSKGSVLNVSQMIACVGQQIIGGKRVPDGFQERSLPHFPKKSREPPSKGFVSNSFYTGLRPTEFLFHAISGREGLVDTAVKTAETGYMQRRLMKALEDLVTHYDTSVRTSSGGIVQFRFGDDGLDPGCLEGQAQPVDFDRAWMHAGAITARDGRALLPFEIMDLTNEILQRRKFKTECSTQYLDSLRAYIQAIARHLGNVRQEYKMYDAVDRDDDWDADTDLSLGAGEKEQQALENRIKITSAHVESFLNTCWAKYVKSKIEPGSTVGAVGAQSIGEPGTQMTLKTFHFAGVASMNVTLGVPRIKEIINAAKVISTPIISAKLVERKNETAARIVKGRLEKTYLGDVASVIEEAWAGEYTYIGVHLDMDAIRKLQLELTIEDVKRAIVNSSKVKVKDGNITVDSRKNRLKIFFDSGEFKYYELRATKRVLADIVVKGSSQIQRAVINKIEKDKSPRGKPGENELLVEGYGLLEVMTTEGVVGEETTGNHVIEVGKVLGIEAARSTIIHEIQYTMENHGMNIDPRHVMLLGDVMTYKGEVLGITRFGVAKMKDSVLMLASFEKTTDHLFDAAAYGKSDAILGVSESIIMGNPANNCGTSMPALVTPAPVLPKRRALLFEAAVRG
ncbi:subunit of DNA dependent RNA-polymerase [Dacryopinax primogenitus]|uniref:DNA-directed RNA polymerase subunit n=1 Tax=Dacryopinax primogenitus (strain DJM 731) TaxID=1858805 RepID=M5GCC2_DACPD|nr:subunit of DNA dependent RNA-polymerase [Dacryopinax primogenitus]EJU06145.1 subunit of DNA dependent RNA-polymerase [Dacryopinax primogenitus]